MRRTKTIIKSPMSSELIEKYLDGHANVVMLSDIPSKYGTLDEIFGDYDHVILFTATQSPTVGHWQLIYKNSLNQVHFFDSYGFKPHELLAYVQQKTGETFGQNNHLAVLLRDAQCQYNNHKYQADGDVQTCGRYVVLNLVLRHIVQRRMRQPYDGTIFFKAMELWKKQYSRSYDEIVSIMIDKLNEDEEY